MEISGLQKKLREKTIMVIGDLMLDKFQYGRVDRISPEAPVPIMVFQKEIESPGGAANVVKNLSGLDVRTLLFGSVGNDAEGARLRKLLGELKNVDTSGIYTDPDRQTTSKYRIIGNHQQIVRVDHEDVRPLSSAAFSHLRNAVRRKIDEVSAVIISDYGKGVITRQLIGFILGLKRKHEMLVSVDPKTGHFFFYKGVDLITPNAKEAGEAAGLRIQSDATLKSAALKIRSRLKCRNLLVTLGADGMALYNKDHQDGYKIPTRARQVFDVSGAGDAVISAMTAAMAAGYSPEMSAHFANQSAGIVVGESGTTAISWEKLRRIGIKSL